MHGVRSGLLRPPRGDEKNVYNDETLAPRFPVTTPSDLTPRLRKTGSLFRRAPQAVTLQTPAAVESWSPSPDQFQFAQLDAEFVGTRLPDHLTGVFGNALLLGTFVACGKVSQQPITELGGHSDVDELAFTIHHAVNAGRRRAEGTKTSPHLAMPRRNVQRF